MSSAPAAAGATEAVAAPAAAQAGVRAIVGFASKTGPRKANEDFAGALFGAELPEPRQEVIAAIADGIGGAKGGRIAAETAVRGFLDGFCDLPETMEVQRAGARIVSSLNSWVNGMGRQDPAITGLGCTFTALVLRGRVAHLLHVGDTRAYRLSGSRLTCLTVDHVRQEEGGRSHTLTRALGVEPEVRLDYATQPVALHDRFLLCSDGVHGFLADDGIAEILRDRSAPEDTASALVNAALEAGGTDNTTALVLDVVGLPAPGSGDISAGIRRLPIVAAPSGGETIDGFLLKALISDGRYSRLFAAADEIEGGEVAIKFPKPQIASIEAFRSAFVREAWVGARVHNPWVGRVIELPPGRQTCLYTVMPLYSGELLEARLARSPQVGLEEGRNIAVKLARAVAALHRDGIIHRDIKPDNVILEGGGSLKLIDLGVVRVPGLEEFPAENIPGTLAYMAPEMAEGEAGNEATDIFALGVTMFRGFTRQYPYANADAVSPPRRSRPLDLSELRPDLPAWVQATIGRAIAIDPAKRFRDMTEFAVEMEAGPARDAAPAQRPRTLYERAPVRVWQAISALLAAALAASLLLRH
ncbi:MAG: bifunctional protein-serine/threonine kinase/phosphatase [Alphaproteobacteria bacterium]|nr:bifunctional protein-serine/threonine kinase/phosphatase [Alphaproteobacteria bacterium]